MKIRIGKAIITMAAAFAIASASGCLISTSSETYETGHFVSPGELASVEIDHTTEHRLIHQFGEPTIRRSTDRPGTEILMYEHTKVKKSRGRVLILFSGRNRRVTHQTTCFEVTDGIVTRYWSEE